MKLRVLAVVGLAVGSLVAGLAATPSAWAADPPTSTSPASSVPTITSLSHVHGSQWGGQRLTVRGTNLSHVYAVQFGSKRGYNLTVVSDTTLQVTTPSHGRGTINVHAYAGNGNSRVSSATRYTFLKAKPSYRTTPLNQGMTAAQAHAVGEKLKRKARRVAAAAVAPRKLKWSPARGQAAAARAKSWVGAPYAWAGGNARGPAYGACVNSDPTWFDCKIFGFDCSGLAMYAWGANLSLAHYAATQYHQAGSYHPKRGELMPGDLLFYSSNGKASGIEHVAIYYGNGQMIEAPMSGWTVHVTPVRLTGDYYRATRPLAKKSQAGSAPVVTRLSATSGPVAGGQTITVTGSHFTRATSVSFGALRTYAVRVLSSHKLQVTVPQRAAGRTNVRVSNAWGTSAVVVADRYTYQNPVTPAPPTPPVSSPPSPPAPPTPSATAR